MKPTFLIASPQMKDPFFEGTVVLVWHHDADGALGVVVNREMDATIAEALEDEEADLSPYETRPVLWGGPVEMQSGTVLSRQPIDEDMGWNLAEGMSITRSMETLRELLALGVPFDLCLGYAGWGAAQLEDELKTGSWIWTDLDPALIFDHPAEERYDRALATLGLTKHAVWMPPAEA